MEIIRRIQTEDLRNNILEYLVYPQPYLDFFSKYYIYEKSKIINLNNIGASGIDVFNLYEKEFEVIIYDDLREVVHLYYDTFSNLYIIQIYLL